jgi:hypothetical protein
MIGDNRGSVFRGLPTSMTATPIVPRGALDSGRKTKMRTSTLVQMNLADSSQNYECRPSGRCTGRSRRCRSRPEATRPPGDCTTQTGGGYRSVGRALFWSWQGGHWGRQASANCRIERLISLLIRSLYSLYRWRGRILGSTYPS